MSAARFFVLVRQHLLTCLKGVSMTALINRIPRDPRRDSCRDAWVLSARTGQRGFTGQELHPGADTTPVLDFQFHAGFSDELRTP
jgi:hypothetical protein